MKDDACAYPDLVIQILQRNADRMKVQLESKFFDKCFTLNSKVFLFTSKLFVKYWKPWFCDLTLPYR